MNNIYVDYCEDHVVDMLQSTLNIKVIVRDNDKWNINYAISIIMDTHTEVLVIHNINEMSIVEIGLAAFMNKRILVANNSIKEYDKLVDMITDIEPGCDLAIENNSFINWYTHFVR